MRRAIHLRDAFADPALMGHVLVGPTWSTWRTVLIAANGERLTDAERAVFKQVTGGREHEPLEPVEEFIGNVGRRGGKSQATAAQATYTAGLCEHPALVPGERGIVLIIAPDQRQADIVLDYVEANFRGSPILKQLIDGRAQRSLRLTNNINIEVRASDFRSLRGPTYVACVADELAFWMTDTGSSLNPDSEILAAVRPGLATTSGPLFMISSPYARRGEFYRAFSKNYGPQGDPRILAVTGPSTLFNPSLPQSVVDRAMERDPASASAEYLAQFRTDIESFVSIEMINACVTPGIRERLRTGSVGYDAFCDPSGGSADSMAICIAHNDFSKQEVVIDVLREAKPPFSPEAVVEEFSRVLKSYGISKIYGDRYAGVWPVEQFSKFSITYEQSAAPKSDLYRDLLPLINSRRIALLDHPKMIAQLANLERKVMRGGRDSIDHPPGGHDDLCNCVAGVASISNRYGGFDTSWSFVDGGDSDDPHGIEAYRAARRAAYYLSGGLFKI